MRRVAYILHTLAPQFIKWPVDERAIRVMMEFEKASAFPNVIGAIDGTHIKIKSPREDKQSYVNRKGYHSIHVQVRILRIYMYEMDVFIFSIFLCSILFF